MDGRLFIAVAFFSVLAFFVGWLLRGRGCDCEDCDLDGRYVPTAVVQGDDQDK